MKGVSLSMGKIIRGFSASAVALGLYFMLPAYAALAASQQLNLDAVADPQITPMPSMVSLFFKLFISLIIIAGLAYLMMKLLRKNMKILSRGLNINVLDQYAFSINKGIYITQITGKVYVLGVTDHNINLITEITDETVINEIVARAKEREAEPIIPPSLIERILPGVLSQNAAQDNSFNAHIQKQIKKLQKMVDNRGGSSREDDNDE